MSFPRAPHIARRAISSVQVSRGDLSGAFADLGLLIPLEASLIAVNGLNPTSTLLGVGVMYIAAGWYFGLPMPVQPLKALAAIAIARELSPDVIAAGALLMSAALALLAFTGLVDRLHRLVPPAVIKGIQLGLAYILIRGAVSMLGRPLDGDGAAASLHYATLNVPLMLAVAPGALLVMVALIRRPLLPASLAVLGAGLVAGVVVGNAGDLAVRPGPAALSFSVPGLEAFQLAAAVLLTAQLPLTLANSVISTTDAAERYFPGQAGVVTPRRLSLSIAAGNVWAGLAGGLPVCHGSGGLTAHYSMGARRPLATAITGITLVAMALAFGDAGQALRQLVPLPFFGLLLLFVGVQHARLAMDLRAVHDVPFVILAGALAVAFDGNLAYAAGLTLVAWYATREMVRVWPRAMAGAVSPAPTHALPPGS